MAWTAPRTWASGEIVTAANMNTHVRDNMKAAAGADQAVCRIFHNTTQSINTATLTALAFNSERFDTQGIHSTSTNTERMTIPTGWGGLWLIGYTVQWAANTGGYRQVLIRANGTTVLSDEITNSTSSSGYARHVGSTMTLLAAGDYIEIVVAHDVGSALSTVSAFASSPEAWCIWLGSG